jgi:diphthamide biosynthesis protein 7
LGGGIWRIKWHPYKEERMLVAAMHGGCRVVEVGNWESLDYPHDDSFDDDDEPQFYFRVTNEFCEHESMAYGADWLVCKHPTRNGFFEAAASCSFYDRAVFLWDSCED